jgi:hypothetical protein
VPDAMNVPHAPAGLALELIRIGSPAWATPSFLTVTLIVIELVSLPVAGIVQVDGVASLLAGVVHTIVIVFVGVV